MRRTFAVIARMSRAYGMNTLLYRLKRFPLVGRLVPGDVYANPVLKKMAEVIIILFRTIWAFGGKFLYLWLMIALPAGWMPGGAQENYLHILLFCTLLGAVANAEMFNPTKDKFYAVNLMGADAREYALSSFLWYTGKTAVTLLPASAAIGKTAGIPLAACLLFPFLAAGVKLTACALLLGYYKRTGRAIAVNKGFFVWAVILTGCLLAYGLPFAGIRIGTEAFCICAAAGLLSAGWGLPYLYRSTVYKKLYKVMVTRNTVIFHVMEDSAKLQQTAYLSKISEEKVNTGKKKGYDYFNEIFLQRHKKILTSAAVKTALTALVFVAAAAAAALFSPRAGREINRQMMVMLPYFVFVMYLINKGAVITQAMFMNCDHSLLAYGFYRSPETILGLFRVRLRTSVRINLIPASVIACGLPALLLITGGTENPMDYVLLFLAILAMSVFFSVHHLMLYYLLQPYDINMKAKSSAYSIVNTVTYIVCYLFIRLKMATMTFALLTIGFSAAYIALSLFCVYRYAPGRFRLKN